MRNCPTKSDFRRWWARVAALLRPESASALPPRPVFVVVEGPRDIEFLRRISAILHRCDPTIPDLVSLEASGRVVFVPFGGDVRPWAFRLAGTGASELHIYDRETSPETEVRQQVARIVNLRPLCRAFVMRRHSLENYLDADAVFEACGVRITFADQDDVSKTLAQAMYTERHGDGSWDKLPARSRKRHRDKIKRMLNNAAVQRMTPQRLATSDPDHEIRRWLEAIGQLVDGSS